MHLFPLAQNAEPVNIATQSSYYYHMAIRNRASHFNFEPKPGETVQHVCFLDDSVSSMAGWMAAQLLHSQLDYHKHERRTVCVYLACYRNQQ